MMKVCTHAGLSRRDTKLWMPTRVLEIVDCVLGEGLRESGEGGESGGAGNLVFERVFRESTLPASMM